MHLNINLIKKVFVQKLPFGILNEEGNKDLNYWRNIVINSLLLVAVLLGFIALIPSVWLSINEGLYLIAAFDVALYLIVLFLYFNRKISYQIRSTMVIAGSYFVGLVLFFVIGPFGAGPVWLFAFPILAGGLRGSRAAVIGIIINAVTLIVTGFLLAGHFFDWSTLVANPIGKWVVISINFILLNSLASGAVTVIQSGLNMALKNENTLRHSLQSEHDQLLKTNLELNREISERIKADEALRENEEKYRSLIESSDDPIYVVNRKLEYIYANQSLLKRLGKSGSDLEHLRYSDFHSAEEVEAFTEQIDKVIKSRKPLEYEYQSLRDEEYFIRTLSPIIHPITNEITAVTILSKNISEHIKLEQQLQQSQKLDSIGTLAGGVAHDFNNLLTIIQGHAQMAMMEMDEGSPQYKDLTQIIDSATRAASLTRQLLLFSRKQSVELKTMDINRTIQNLLKMLKRLIGEDITVLTNLAHGLSNVEADEGNIEQVIMNLAVNARDAMPDGGKLTITTENISISDSERIQLPKSRTGNFVRISIEDTGHGIPTKILSKIFEPFFSTKEKGKGTGLGLSVVYGIVNKHGGWINVYSEPEHGTIFKIYLPASSLALKGDGNLEIKSKESLHGNGEQVLVIEDEQGILDFASLVLRQFGYNVRVASDGKQAESVFEDAKGDFRLIISDVILPDINGFDLVTKLMQDHSDIPAIMCSGYTEDRVKQAISHEKGFRFLQKPYSVMALLEMVKKAIMDNE